jgi:hypothetical protein
MDIQCISYEKAMSHQRHRVYEYQRWQVNLNEYII